MNLEYFLNKKTILHLNDGRKMRGMIIEIIDGEDDGMPYTKLYYRINYNNYKVIYTYEIESIDEII